MIMITIIITRYHNHHGRRNPDYDRDCEHYSQYNRNCYYNPYHRDCDCHCRCHFHRHCHCHFHCQFSSLLFNNYHNHFHYYKLLMSLDYLVGAMVSKLPRLLCYTRTEIYTYNRMILLLLLTRIRRHLPL